MPRSFQTAFLFAGALFVGILLGAGPRAPRAYAGAAAEPAPDPKKKKAGEPCKKSDECQNHHTCTKVGDKSVCKAPPPPVLPPGAVT